MAFNHQDIEKKWQDRWEAEGVFHASDDASKKKFYCLDMFPYPSSAGLHVGHPEGYTATDIVSRYMRMKGYEVMHPMGWDAFGLPAENFAIKSKIHPSITTKNSIKNFKKQIKSLGLSYDWDREVNTSDPEYYKWTQWIFLQFYKNGLAYKKKAAVNWCESCKRVLANEQVIDGKCERCKNEVIQKDLEQNKNLMFKNYLHLILPRKLANFAETFLEIKSTKRLNEISQIERKRLLHFLKEFSLSVKEVGGFNKAIVTTGGVELTEVDPGTMESKVCPGLFFAGEILDMDGFTGGFNLQASWATGRLAGEHAADSAPSSP